jgi:hypothetical protein
VTHEPLRYSNKVIDAMSDDEKRQTLTYNEDGARRCGWRP